MNERTYRLEDIQRARRDWALGEFSDEWDEWRQLAERGGIIFPPEGSKWDSWDDDDPSQRAVLIRAIRETPQLLEDSMIGARSWGEVVKRLLKGRDDMREDVNLRERDEDWQRQDEPNRRQALESIHNLLSKIRDS